MSKLTKCAFKNKNLQAKSLFSGCIVSSIKDSNHKHVPYMMFQEIERTILKSFNKANITLTLF